MRTIISEVNVYTFAELSETAKEKAKHDFLSTEIRNWDFQDYCKAELEYLFPLSSLEMAYSLSFCQGDGFTVYGNLDYSDIMEKLSANYSEKEQRALKWAFDEFLWRGMEFERSNRNGFYLIPWDCNYLIDEMETYYMKNIPYDLIKRFAEDVNDYMEKFCNKMKDFGYEYLYEISDEDMEEISEFYEWEYMEDGSKY